MKIIKITLVIIAAIVIYDISYGKGLTYKILFKVFRFTPGAFSPESYEGLNYRIYKPTGYEKQNGSNHKYPLVVYLHGAGERGNDNRKQIYDLPHIGSGYNKQSKQFQKKYPSFVYVPQCPSKSSWNSDDISGKIVKTISKLLSTYPIDKDRLYLIGYSMGGSGTYSIASKFYEVTKHPFAAIVRMAGQGSFDYQVHKNISKSSVWLHVGLRDSELRVNKAREAYDTLKKIHKDVIENKGETGINNHPGTTMSLVVNDVEIVKKTEYENDGHSISHLPFKNPLLLEWVFAKRIAKK